MKKYNFYPFSNSKLALDSKKVFCENNKVVIKTSRGHFCGYVLFKSKDLPKAWNNLEKDRPYAMTFLAIHGGLSYFRKEGTNVVFGFDCGHAGDEENEKLKDLEYVKSLVNQMEDQIREFLELWPKYKKSDFKTKLKMIEKLRKKAKLKTSIDTIAMFCASIYNDKKKLKEF